MASHAPARATGARLDSVATYRALSSARARLAARDAAILHAQITLAEIAAPTGEEHERGAFVARRVFAPRLPGGAGDETAQVIGPAPGGRGAPPPFVCAPPHTPFPPGTSPS